jgi:drug/metabolite transporter (DMT)-like permease
MAATARDRHSGRITPILGLLGLALVWGLSIPVTKIGLRDVPPLTLTALRYGAATPFFVAFLIGKPVPRGKTLARLACLGLLGIGFGQAAQAFGVKFTSASIGTVISSTIPVFMVAAAAWRLRQPVRPCHALGLLVALCGIGVLAMGGPSGGAGGSMLGDASVLCAAVAIALYYVLAAELTNSCGVIVVAAWSSLFGAIGLLPPAIWECGRYPVRFTLEGVGAVLYLGVLVTVAGLWIWFTLLRVVPVRIAASVQYLQPLVGVGVSAAWFGDRLGAAFLTGAGLVLCGIALTSSNGALGRSRKIR